MSDHTADDMVEIKEGPDRLKKRLETIEALLDPRNLEAVRRFEAKKAMNADTKPDDGRYWIIYSDTQTVSTALTFDEAWSIYRQWFDKEKAVIVKEVA